MREPFAKQERIPVGCVSSAAVAVWRGGGLPRGCLPGGVSAGGEVSARPPVNRITDRCQNITLPQLRCGR